MSETPIADMVAELVAAGCSADVILIAVRGAELYTSFVLGQFSDMSKDNENDVLARRRKIDRNRKRLERAYGAVKSSGLSLDVSEDNASQPSPSSSPPTPSLITTPSPTQEKNTRARDPESKRGSRLQDDWMPADDDWGKAVSVLGQDRAKTELAKFRDYWRAAAGARGVKLDWAATWRNWVRTAGERRATGPPRGQSFFDIARENAKIAMGSDGKPTSHEIEFSSDQ